MSEREYYYCKECNTTHPALFDEDTQRLEICVECDTPIVECEGILYCIHAYDQFRKVEMIINE